jgi:hypothetical protein
MTTSTTDLVNVPLPAGAVKPGESQVATLPSGSIEPIRDFDGSSWIVERDDLGRDICVGVAGTQHADGHSTRHV